MRGNLLHGVHTRTCYVVRGLISEGAYGTVYEASTRDPATGAVGEAKFAIKFIPLLSTDQAHLKRVMREVLILNKLKHPHVIAMRDLVETPAFVCRQPNVPRPTPAIGIVMERAPRSLERYLEHVRCNNRTLSEHVVRFTFQQLMLVAAFCHSKGIGQRDIKPGNILLFPTPAGSNSFFIKLADFGWSKCLANSLAVTCDAGTYLYMAPEVPQGQESHYYNAMQADIWSSGVVLFHLLFPYTFEAVKRQVLDPNCPHYCPRYVDWLQQLPFLHPMDTQAAVSGPCLQLLTRMLERNPDRRVTTAEVLQDPWFREGLPQGALELNSQAHDNGPTFNEGRLRRWLHSTILQYTGIGVQ